MLACSRHCGSSQSGEEVAPGATQNTQRAQAGATRASALVGHGVSLRRSGFRLKDAEWEVGFKSDLAWASDLGSGPGY